MFSLPEEFLNTPMPLPVLSSNFFPDRMTSQIRASPEITYQRRKRFTVRSGSTTFYEEAPTTARYSSLKGQ
jgi:hypothetical protein